MATIVEHQKSGNRYILVGSGFTISKISSSNSPLTLTKTEEEEHYHLMAVCDRRGLIRWFYADDLIVIEIDGKKPTELI